MHYVDIEGTRRAQPGPPRLWRRGS